MTIQEEDISKDNLVKFDASTASFSPGELLQSSRWLLFQQFLGRKVQLFSWRKDTETGWFFGYIIKAPFGFSYFYIPRGPLVKKSVLWPDFLIELKKVCKAHSVTFIRFEPNATWPNNFSRDSFVSVYKIADTQPALSFHSNLALPEADLLTGMHQKTRYNIRLSLKKDLLFTANDKHYDDFLALMKETAERDGFGAHDKDYYIAMLKSGTAFLATVRNASGEILAAGLFAGFGSIITYLHGASSSEHRDLMAPYFLHWNIMLWAKTQSYLYYDWHGIDEHKWPGVTRFKKGFGGEEVIYPGTYDIPLDTLSYSGYTLGRGVQRLMTRLFK